IQAMTIASAEGRRRSWLAANPKAQQNINALGPMHHAALQAGLLDASDEYFEFMQSQLAALPAETSDMPTQPTPKFSAPPAAKPPASNKVIVSAPVSRDIPSVSSGKRDSSRVTLSLEEQQIAKASGISLQEYAKQKLRLAQMRASGEYADREDQR